MPKLRSQALLAASVIMLLLICAVSAPAQTGAVRPLIKSTTNEYNPEQSGLLESVTDDGEVTLSWTAPGDDGNTGRATGYDLRYRSYAAGPIENEQDWQSSISVVGEPSPSPAGQRDSMVVGGLEGGASYYFCIKSYDDAGNFSGLSNCVLKTASDLGLTLSIYIIGQGNVIVEPDRQYYDYGQIISLHAQPEPYWDFTGWTGDIQSNNNPVTFPITDDLNITAHFETDFVPGDANGDGDVLISDVTYLVNFFRGVAPSPDPYLAGDANGNCAVNGQDVTYLVCYFRNIGEPPIRGDCDNVLVAKAEGDRGAAR